MRAVRMIVLLALVGPLIMLPGWARPAPAAADAELAVSRDGEHWRSDLQQPLFDPAVRWVPGDSSEASFWVRNDAATSGRLTVALLISDDTDRLLADDVLRLSARTGDGAWTPMPADGGTIALDASLAAGASLRVTVRADYSGAATNRTQRDLASLGIRATLTQSEATVPSAPPTGGPSGRPTGEPSGTPTGSGPGGPGNGGPGNGGPEQGGPEQGGGVHGGGGLAGTGSAVPPLLLPLAAAAIGAGLAMIRPRNQLRRLAVRRNRG